MNSPYTPIPQCMLLGAEGNEWGKVTCIPFMEGKGLCIFLVDWENPDLQGLHFVYQELRKYLDVEPELSQAQSGLQSTEKAE